MNIKPTDKLDSPLDKLNINQESSEKNKLKIRNIFARRYLEPERPEEPKVDAEISLSTEECQPFHFSPRKSGKFWTTY